MGQLFPPLAGLFHHLHYLNNGIGTRRAELGSCVKLCVYRFMVVNHPYLWGIMAVNYQNYGGIMAVSHQNYGGSCLSFTRTMEESWLSITWTLMDQGCAHTNPPPPLLQQRHRDSESTARELCEIVCVQVHGCQSPISMMDHGCQSPELWEIMAVSHQNSFMQPEYVHCIDTAVIKWNTVFWWDWSHSTTCILDRKGVRTQV